MPRSSSLLHANKQLLVDIDGLSVTLGAELALDNVSLCVHSGEFVGVIGPNGAGKTTLLRAMLGLITPTQGKVQILRDQVGYISQNSAQHDQQLTINVLEVAKLGARGSRSQAIEALTAVGTADLQHKKFTELSGGQQQRVLIAKALANNPKLLILDEPTTGIDERSQSEFYNVLRNLQKKGIAIIMVSHDVDAVLTLVTRVICLNRSVLYDGAPEHFEADKYLPSFYNAQHRQLHHHHGGQHA